MRCHDFLGFRSIVARCCSSALRNACAMSIVPHSKKPRRDGVAALKASLPYISQSVLAAVLEVAKHQQLPDITSRLSLRKSRNDYVNQVTPYGTLHQALKINDQLTIGVQHPFAMIYHVTQQCARFSSLMQRALDENPSDLLRKWRITFYSDEVNPGNQLAYKHGRKTRCPYWSFMELGPALSSEAAISPYCLPSTNAPV